MVNFKFKTAMVTLVATVIMFLVACHKDNSIQKTEFSPLALYSPTETSDAERAAAIIAEFGGAEVDNIIKIVVEDILGSPIANAEVTLNGEVYLTDEDGKVEIEDATILENFGYIKVHKEGYFDGSRTFAAVDAEHGSTVSVAIKLFPLGEPTTVPAGSPSTVIVPTPYGDARVELSGEYLDEDGSPYAGNVQVYAKYLDPLSPEISTTMPGALLGVTTQNQMVGLVSYGMLNVQMIGDAGQQLQIGSPATLRAPIPPDQLADAPAEIPTWYFNETAGVWIEEGTGYRDGNDYVAVVSHFTWWNWDVPPSLTSNLFIKVLDLCGNEVVGATVTVVGYGSGTYMGGGWVHNYVFPNVFITVNASYTAGLITYSGTQTIITGGAGSNNYVTITLNFYSSDCIVYSINGGLPHIDNSKPNGEELSSTDMFVEAFDRSNPLAKTRIESHTTTVKTGYPYGSMPGEMEFTDFSDPDGMLSTNNFITFDLVNYPAVGGMIEIDFQGNYDDNLGVTKSISGKAYVQRRR